MDDSSIAVMILLQVVLILCNAVFACAEIAMISMNDAKVAKLAASGDKRAVRLAALASQPARFLATIQVAITLSGFLGSAFASENFSDALAEWLSGLGVPLATDVLDSIAVVFITFVLSYVTLIFGELVPKQLAMRRAEQLALGMSALIGAISRLFAPVVWILTISTNAILRLFGVDPDAPEESQNAYAFDDLSAEGLVTHRKDVILLDVRASMSEWERVIAESRHTLYPVCEASADKIIGVLDTGIYFRMTERSRETVMRQAVSPPYFVPDTVKADTLFRNMKNGGHRLAVVLDEYGGMSGIVTEHDLMERLTGTREAAAQGAIRQEAEGEYRIDGTASLEEVSETLGIPLACEGCDTFGGLILHELGSIPEDGACIELTLAGYAVQVTGIRSHRIETAVVRREPDNIGK